MKFIGREKELADISAKLLSDRSEALLVYGRRRMGKSELIRQAMKLVEKKETEDTIVIRYVCRKSPFEQNLQGLTKAVNAALGEKHLAYEDLGELAEDVFSRAERTGKKVVLYIDEYPLIRGNDAGVDSCLQIAYDEYHQRGLIKLILCGSYIDIMQKVIEGDSPLFGRFSYILKLGPFDYYTAARFYPECTQEDKLVYYSFLGGVPFYLNMIDHTKTPLENMQALLIPSGSILENEIQLQLAEELRKVENANFILEKIGRGVTKYTALNEAYSGTGGITYLLKRLTDLGLIEKVFPINAKEDKKKVQYFICDNLLDFYYRFLYGESTARETMNPKRFYKELVEDVYRTQYLPEKFEQITKEYLIRQNTEDKIDPPFTAIGRFIYNDRAKKKNGEFDVVTEDKNGWITYECKYTNDKIGNQVIRSEVYEAQQLGLDFYRFGFVSRNGFTEDIERKNHIFITLQDMYR